MDKHKIEFRAKDDECCWVYGYPVQTRKGWAMIVADTWPDDTDMLQANLWCDIDPGTIGMWTGLHDKNGKEIYDGDVFAVYTESGKRLCTYQVQMREDTNIFGVVMLSDPSEDRPCCEFPLDWFKKRQDRIEVVGNIHDIK